MTFPGPWDKIHDLSNPEMLCCIEGKVQSTKHKAQDDTRIISFTEATNPQEVVVVVALGFSVSAYEGSSETVTIRMIEDTEPLVFTAVAV